MPRFCISRKSQCSSSPTIKNPSAPVISFIQGICLRNTIQKKTSANNSCDSITQIIPANLFHFLGSWRKRKDSSRNESEPSICQVFNHAAVKNGTIFCLQRRGRLGCFSLLSKFLLTILLQSMYPVACTKSHVPQNVNSGAEAVFHKRKQNFRVILKKQIQVAMLFN